MPGIRPVFEKGPLTFSATTAANGGLISGGRLVEPDGTTGRIKLAEPNSVTVLGVALGDAAPSDLSTTDGTDAWGNTVTNMTYHPNEVAVAYQGVWLLTNRGATKIDFGTLVAAAGTGVNRGGVATWANAAAGALSNTHAVVGRCVEPGGIAVGATGKILLGSVGA